MLTLNNSNKGSDKLNALVMVRFPKTVELLRVVPILSYGLFNSGGRSFLFNEFIFHLRSQPSPRYSRSQLWAVPVKQEVSVLEEGLVNK